MQYSSSDVASNIQITIQHNLYNAILPLLSNLKQNPEKEYILWPNRLEKIEAFEDHISGIIK